MSDEQVFSYCIKIYTEVSLNLHYAILFCKKNKDTINKNDQQTFKKEHYITDLLIIIPYIIDILESMNRNQKSGDNGTNTA